MKRAYVDIREGQVHYQFGGRGHTVLLLHSAAQSSGQFSKVGPILERRYRVIAMDTLGYGKSDPPPGRYTIPDYAGSVVRFLEALDIRQTSIVGHLTGSALAVEIAATNPSLVSKLVLSICPLYAVQERLQRQNDPRSRAPEIRPDGSHLMTRWNQYKGISATASPETWQSSVLNYLNAGARAEEGHLAMYSYELEKRLPLVRCPTLLVSGPKALFRDRLETIEGLVPRCTTRLIEGADSFVTLEKAEEYAEAVIAFLG